MPFALMLPALLLAALVAAGGQAAAEELLTNGDFTLGPVGWMAFNDLRFETDSCDWRSADHAAGLHLDDGGDGWLESDAVPIEPGGTYEASGYARFAAGVDQSPQLLLVLAFYETVDGKGDALPMAPFVSLPIDAAVYTPITTGPTVPPDQARSARLLVTFSASGPTSACVDDLSLEGPRASPTETPSPTIPAPSSTPASSPTPTVTPTATEVPMPSGSILNGGFEEGVEDMPAAWQKFGGFLYRSAAFSRSGSFAGAFSSSTDSTKWVYQPFSVDPGRSYAFHGFVLKNGPPDSTVLLRISWYSSPDASGSSLGSIDSPESLSGSDPSFRYLSTGSVTAPEEAHSARARIVLVPASATSETIYLDDFALEETAPPTPASGGESEEAASPGGQAAAAGEPEPLTGPSARSSSESDGGVRSPSLASAASATQAREGRAYEDSPYAVKISEVLANAGAGLDDAAHEWVELYNAGPESVELGGWSLADNVAADTLPPAALPPGAYAVVTASPDFQRQYPAFQGALLVLADGRIGNGLANESDRLLLVDEEGRPVDALSYGLDREFFEPPAPTVPPGHSLERFPPDRDTDTAADFRDNAYPSPGAGPPAGLTPPATASPISEVLGQALAVAGSGSGFSWPWLLLAAGLVFVGGTGAGVAGVLFWLARGRRS